MSKILSILGLAVLGIAILVGAAAASNTADMVLTNEVTESIEVTVSPASFSDWDLSVGSNTYTTVATTATISSNVGTGKNAVLYAKESADGSNSADGCMRSSTLSHIMGAALALDANTPATATDISTLSAANQALFTLADAGSQEVDFDYKQAVGYSDPAASDYKITVTFSGALVSE